MTITLQYEKKVKVKNSAIVISKVEMIENAFESATCLYLWMLNHNNQKDQNNKHHQTTIVNTFHENNSRTLDSPTLKFSSV